MKLLAAMILTLASSIASAADYTVGIVANTGHNRPGVRLYETTTAGIRVVQTYVLAQQTASGAFVTPLTLAINPAHTFVYIAYTSPAGGLPNLFGFKITATGLVLQWEQPIYTADIGMQGGYLVAGPNYVVEHLYPIGPWVYVVNQSGEQIAEEVGEETNFISSSIDSSGLYYSCRSATAAPFPNGGVGPVEEVLVYQIWTNSVIYINEAKPIATSTDPAYIQSVCAS